ncbi:MAG: GNAT family N-acetyltransferase, partial [Ignavibacteriae bacterium]|nr:GNAT family N-acetyltransferase [Ignavibacteriota bacterium]
IYAGDEMVGFIMYAKDPDDGIYYINRFMIDEKHQNKGYGEKALSILLKELKENDVKSVDIIHKPDNEVAIKLYNRLGFKLTDQRLGDDVISTLNFN